MRIASPIIRAVGILSIFHPPAIPLSLNTIRAQIFDASPCESSCQYCSISESRVDPPQNNTSGVNLFAGRKGRSVDVAEEG